MRGPNGEKTLIWIKSPPSFSSPKSADGQKNCLERNHLSCASQWSLQYTDLKEFATTPIQHSMWVSRRLKSPQMNTTYTDLSLATGLNADEVPLLLLAASLKKEKKD